MNYTEKYHLPQWERSDRILMEDFNQAMTDIEAGMAEAKDVRPYAAGLYNANGEAVTIELGFRPAFLLIFSTQGGPTAAEASGYTYIGSGGIHSGVVDFIPNGFTVRADAGIYPRMNQNRRQYVYIAFR